MGWLLQEGVNCANGTSHRVTSNKTRSTGNLQAQICMQHLNAPQAACTLVLHTFDGI